MQQIGRYEIIEELGRGAMGAVYKARDPQIGRVVAIKVILSANLSPDDFQHYKERFQREAQAAGQMSHPGIITIYDISVDDKGHPFIVMEYIEGRTLEKMLTPPGEAAIKTDSGLDLPKAQPRLLVSTALDVGIQLAEALDYAHKRKIIHRDIKPANILITSEGRVKVLDFGIAKLPGSQMTQTGMMMGTPAFMSPEQVSASPLDHRSDIFSLGGVLYWMFTGEKPFPGDSLTAITFKIAFAQPLPANYLNRALPPEIDVVLSRCLAKNVNDRYPDAAALAEDLRAIKEGRPIKTTHAPAVDQTAMQETAPLRQVAAGLPPEARAVQEQAAKRGETYAVGSGTSPRPAEPAAAVAPAATQPAAVSAATPLPQKKSSLLVVVLSILGLGAALLAGYLLWKQPGVPPQVSQISTAQQPAPPVASDPQTEAAPAAEDAAKQIPTASPTPAKKSPAAPASAAPTSVSPPPERPAVSKPAAMSLLEIEVKHNFKQAELIIHSNGKAIFQAVLDDKNKTLRASVELPASPHVLKVRVRAERDKFDQEKETDGIFREGQFRKLSIGFGRGSGIGFTKRELNLKLSESLPFKQ
jgi:serine/threonine-protein kinase